MASKRRRSNKHEKKPFDGAPKLTLTCVDCGFQGTMAEFLKKDPGDTTCPNCGCDDHVVNL